MEKNKPHCPLSRVKALIEAGKVHITTTARISAAELGYTTRHVYAEVMCLRREEFHKSMTSYHDSSSWQDVYRHHVGTKDLYIKLMVMDDVLVVSFKEL